MNTCEYILDKIAKQFNLEIYSDNIMDFYRATSDDILIRVIPPHEGNNFRYIVRAEYPETFDKWGNTTYETYCKADKDLDLVIEDIEKLIKLKSEILVKKYDEEDLEEYYEINYDRYENIDLKGMR